MRASAVVIGALLAIVCADRAASARPPQDVGDAQPRDNLVHEPGYATAELGSLGALVERGEGPIDMVLISGFGLGASAFEGFITRNASRYRMIAVTLAGFERTAAPPMPAAGTSYGARPWTRGAIDGVARLIRDRGLDRPVLVGHFLNGTDVAARVAIEHPELARALVLIAGSPCFEPRETTPSWPTGLTVEQRIAGVDRSLAPLWFKTVARETWVANNFVASDYSIDAARGRTFADRANEPPLPVLIRYLCEYHASDLRLELARLEQPLLRLQPRFTEALRADPKRSYLQAFFDEPWRGVLEGRPRTVVELVDEAGILLHDDAADRVDRAIASFLEQHVASTDER